MSEVMMALGAVGGSGVTMLGQWLLRRHQLRASARRDETEARSSEWLAILASNRRLVAKLESTVAKRDAELAEAEARFEQCERDHREARRRIADLEEAVAELQRLTRANAAADDTMPAAPAKENDHG